MAEAIIVTCDYDGNPIRRLKNAQLQSFESVRMDIGNASFVYDPLDEGGESLKLGGEVEAQIWLEDYHDGEDPAWWGVPLSRRGPLSALTVSCQDLLWHLSKRIVDTGSLLFTSVDQITIFMDLVTKAQTGTDMDLNFDFSPFMQLPPGPPLNYRPEVPRSRNYARSEHKDILSLLKEFPTLSGGFDWWLTITGNRGPGARRFNFYYNDPSVPDDGFSDSTPPLRWLNEGHSGNIRSINWADSADDIGTDGYVMGATSGDVVFEGHYIDAVASAQYGRRQFVTSEGSQKDPGWLLERAEKEVENRNHPIVVPDVTVARFTKDGLDALDIYKPGTRVLVQIDHGPIQLDQLFRVLKTRYNRDDTVTLTWAE